MENKALVLCDSINSDIVYADGSHPRCTTFDLTFWRALLAEFNTHQMIVKSSASSRAIPFSKMYAKVKEFPFVPMKFQRDHKGMQGQEYFEEPEHSLATQDWLKYKEEASLNAMYFNSNGVTKQLANRLLEPFMWHEVLATATEYENFFALRASEYAEIHFADLAYRMLEAYNTSIPQALKGGQWHLPYGDQIDDRELYLFYKKQTEGMSIVSSSFHQKRGLEEKKNEYKLSISTARCARKSYKTLGDNPIIDFAKDIELDSSLIANGHMAPTSHPNRAMTEKEYFQFAKSFVLTDGYLEYMEANKRFIDSGHTVVFTHEGKYANVTEFGWCKQFRGFIPRRQLISNENRSDSRVIKK